MSIHIGAHPSNLTLTALAHEPGLQEKLRQSGFDIVFRWYAEGRLIHQALDVEEIDVIGTGSTRAIVAQADGVPITYIAASQPRTTGAAILVPDGSPIKSPRDLAGRRVGLIDGSFHTYFLVAVLEAAGVSFSEVNAINWPIKDSDRALRAGEFDAWISMAPYLAPALSAGGLRSLVGCDAVIPNRSVFWVRQNVVDKGKPAVEIIARSLADTDRWIAADPKRAGQLFARIIGGVSEESWALSIAARKWGLVAADDTVLAEQQREADLLARHGLLKRTIDLQNAALKYPLDFDRQAA
jgi:ABC-type nitrate/sulfonate/bicarbonate transport system substrate-binding protein